MTDSFKPFRSCPTKGCNQYLNWLAKVEQKKYQLWKDMGIFDLIQLSKVRTSYCQHMLMASLYSWDNTFNIFHLPCGMITPTLFDMAAITGLRPTGEAFDPSV